MSPTRRHQLRRSARVVVFLHVAIATAMLLASADATTVYWDKNGSAAGAGGPSANGVWDASSTSSWTTNSAGTAAATTYATANGNSPSTADVIFSAGFDATGTSTITISGAVTARSITIEDGSIATATSGTPSITLGSGGLTIGPTSVGASSFNLNTALVLSASQTWTNYISSAFTDNGTIAGNATAGTTVLTLTSPSSGGGLTLAGAISDGTGGGKLGITIAGGTQTLSSTSSAYSGQLTVQSGTLKIDTANNASANGELGNSANSVILGGSGTTGTLEYTGTTASPSTSKTFTMATGGTGVFQVDNAATNLTVSGLIDGSGGLTKTGSGTLSLTASNTYAGPTTVNNGSLTVDFNGSGAPTTNIINSTSNSSTLVLGGGTLTVNTKKNASNSQRFNGLTLNPGASSIVTIDAGGSTSLSVTLGAITRNVGSTLDLTIGLGPISTTTANDANGLLGAGITVGGNDWATKSGSNIVAFSGYTTQNAVGSWAANQNLQNSGAFTGSLGANLTINSLRFDSNTATGPNLGSSTLTVLDGILIDSNVSSKALTISGGSLRGSSGGDLVVINNGAGTTNLTISSNIVDNTSATAFTKSGAGLVKLSGSSNTYTGATYVNQGTLAAGVATSAFGSNSAVVISTGATLDITGFNETIGSLASNNVSTGGAGSVVLGTATLTTGGNNADANFGGVISGTGGLNKTGTGTQTLSGANTYTGATGVSGGGTLLVNGSTASGSAVTVNGSGTTLGGIGTVAGSVTLGNTAGGAVINPGPKGTNGTASSVGILTTGALTLTNSATGNILHIDAFGTSQNNWDLLNVNGGVTIGASSILQLSIASGLNFSAGQKFVLIANDLADAISGTFSNAGQGNTVNFSGYDFTVSYTDGTGNDLVLTAVPEPNTWIGAALALLSIGYTQRRKLVPALKRLSL